MSFIVISFGIHVCTYIFTDQNISTVTDYLISLQRARKGLKLYEEHDIRTMGK